MLVVGAVARGKADLRQGVVKARALGYLRQPAVVIDVPAGALGNVADNQPARDVGHPVGKLDWRVR